jgi:hypothetical protein
VVGKGKSQGDGCQVDSWRSVTVAKCIYDDERMIIFIYFRMLNARTEIFEIPEFKPESVSNDTGDKAVRSSSFSSWWLTTVLTR